MFLRENGLTRIQCGGLAIAFESAVTGPLENRRKSCPDPYVSRPFGIHTGRTAHRGGRHRHSCRHGDSAVSVYQGQGLPGGRQERLEESLHRRGVVLLRASLLHDGSRFIEGSVVARRRAHGHKRDREWMGGNRVPFELLSAHLRAVLRIGNGGFSPPPRGPDSLRLTRAESRPPRFSPLATGRRANPHSP